MAPALQIVGPCDIFGGIGEAGTPDVVGSRKLGELMVRSNLVALVGGEGEAIGEEENFFWGVHRHVFAIEAIVTPSGLKSG